MNKIKAITQAGIFAGIHVVFLILANTIIGFDLILLVALPFASALYTIKNKPLYVLLFAFATTLLTLVISVDGTLLYIIPSLVSGISYGYLTKFKFSSLNLVYIMTFISSLLFLFSVYVIYLIGEIDFILVARNFFHLTPVFFENYGYSILVLIGLCQSILTHIIIKEELKHMMIKTSDNYNPNLVHGLLATGLLIASGILFSLNILPLAITLMIFYLMLLIPLAIFGIKLTKKHTIIVVIQAAIILFLILPLIKVLPVDAYIYLISLIFIPYLAKSIFHFFTKNDKIVVK